MPTEITEGETVEGNTLGGQDNLTAASGSLFGPCQNGGTKEAVFSFAAATTGVMTFTLTSVADQGLFVRTTCDDGDTELTCSDGVEGGMEESVSLFVDAGTTYTVVVDGYQAGEEGPFSLTAGTIATETGNCMDGIDNNDDGILFDCHDPSCFADTGCTEAQTTACAAATAIAVGDTEGDTTDGSSVFGTYDPICSAGSGGKVSVLQYAPSGQNELVGFRLSSATDQGVFVRETCADVSTQVACRDAVEGAEDELLVVPMADGAEHTVFVSAYEGGEEGPYVLTTTIFPHDETEPNDTFATADAASTAEGLYCHLTGPDDIDWFSFTLAETSDVSIATTDVQEGDCAASRIDTDLELFEDDGVTSLEFNDDIDEPNDNYCSAITVEDLPAGDYLVRVRSSEEYCPSCTPAYQLTVTTP